MNIVTFDVHLDNAVAVNGVACAKKATASTEQAPTDPSQASSHESKQQRAKAASNRTAVLATLRACRIGMALESQLQQASKFLQDTDSSLRAKGRNPTTLTD